jgi:hypothetical protein
MQTMTRRAHPDARRIEDNDRPRAGALDVQRSGPAVDRVHEDRAVDGCDAPGAGDSPWHRVIQATTER